MRYEAVGESVLESIGAGVAQPGRLGCGAIEFDPGDAEAWHNHPAGLRGKWVKDIHGIGAWARRNSKSKGFDIRKNTFETFRIDYPGNFSKSRLFVCNSR